jgi:SAM-dependent methyltransferase
MNQARFEWSPEFWQGWRESANPYRRYKSERDRRRVVEALDIRDQDRILEVGCGYGWISRALWHAANAEWTGIDESVEMIRSLRAAYPDRGSRAFQADARQLPFQDGEFDKVLCTGVLMHIREHSIAVRELIRVLRPGGVFLCSINNALSPFSVPVRFWNLRKKGFVQKFQVPGPFRRFLGDEGIEVDRTVGDGIIATAPITIGRFSFPPVYAFRSTCKWDAWAVNQCAWLAYEVWFRGVKVISQCAS